MNQRNKRFNICDILLDDAARCMDLYESGADNSETRLAMAKVQLIVAYDRGANIDGLLIRLVNLYRTNHVPK